MKTIWNDRSISLSSKIRLMRSLVTPIFLYACKSWTLTAELQRRIQAMNEVLPQDTMHFIQRPCYQRGSSCQDPAGKRTTRRFPDHRKETQTAVVWTCLPLAKAILQGTVKGERRQGSQGKRWKDNIRELTGLEFAKSQRAVENREKRRKLVVKSSEVPQRPSRLKYR